MTMMAWIPGTGWSMERVERVLDGVREQTNAGKVYWVKDMYSVIGGKSWYCDLHGLN